MGFCSSLLICASLKGWRRSATNLSRTKNNTTKKKTPQKWSSVVDWEIEWNKKLAGAQPPNACSFARRLVAKMAKSLLITKHQPEKKLFLSFMPPQIPMFIRFFQAHTQKTFNPFFFFRTKRQRPLDMKTASLVGFPKRLLWRFGAPKTKIPEVKPQPWEPFGFWRFAGLLWLDFGGYTFEKWRCWTPKMEVWQCLPKWFFLLNCGIF